MRCACDHRILRPFVLAALVSLGHATAPEAGVRVGIQGGLQAARLTYDLDGTTFSEFQEYQPTGTLGAQVLVPLQPHLELESGLRYLEYVNDLEVAIPVTGGTAQFHARHVWRYLAVPAVLRFHPASVPGVFLGGGAEGSYLMTISSDYTNGIAPAGAARADHARGVPARSRRRRQAGPAAQIFEGVGTFGSLNGYYSHWNFAVNGVAGVDFGLGVHTGELQFRYTYGLVDIANSGDLKRETRGLEGLLAFRW